MSITIYPFEKQHKGGFNNDEILENKPIQLSDDTRKLQPYSNIFYWAHAWSNEGSLIEEHPHKIFEIMSFITKGWIEHYDSKNRTWKRLQEGDAQIIRAGSGISHAERLGPGAEMFQIWVDPGIENTIGNPASYDDYSSDSFPVKNEEGKTIKIYHGSGSPLEMVTPGLTIKDITFSTQEQKLEFDDEKVYSIYVVEGEITLNEGNVKKNDFIQVKEEKELYLNSSSEAKIFMIESPAKVEYATYAERYV
ncbi:MAG: hypothetical protein EHM58_13425 [Ignavibacteriae bacterium]|nr:MAG: hypothetical protein EHM58_13425 [Ignavibacteriota bacterium]